MIAGHDDAGHLFLFLVTGGHTGLDVIEEYFGVATMEGVNARPGGAPPAALEAEQLGVETVAPERPQRPAHRILAPLVQDQVGFAHFQLASTQPPASVVHVHHLLVNKRLSLNFQHNLHLDKMEKTAPPPVRQVFSIDLFPPLLCVRSGVPQSNPFVYY